MAIIHWHRLLGTLFEELLPPVQITVHTDFKVMSDPPRADILLLRRHHLSWNDEQLARLPDGVRDTSASHILLEFKYTESLTSRIIHKIIGYDIFYKETQQLPDEAVQTFILSAKTPRRTVLVKYGYQASDLPGVYRSSNPVLRDIQLLVLNELRNEPFNAYVKCFASRKKEKEAAFETLEGMGAEGLFHYHKLWSYLAGLKTYWFIEGGTMEEAITPEKIMEIGERWRQAYISSLTVEERLLGLKPEERLLGLKPEERLLGLKPEEVLSRYKPEERLAGLEPYLDELRQTQKRLDECQALNRVLRVRFKASLEPYQKRLDQLDIAGLEKLNELILTVDALAEFDAALNQTLADLEPAH